MRSSLLWPPPPRRRPEATKSGSQPASPINGVQRRRLTLAASRASRDSNAIASSRPCRVPAPASRPSPASRALQTDRPSNQGRPTGRVGCIGMGPSRTHGSTGNRSSALSLCCSNPISAIPRRFQQDGLNPSGDRAGPSEARGTKRCCGLVLDSARRFGSLFCPTPLVKNRPVKIS
jgi:hypothetical protein